MRAEHCRCRALWQKAERAICPGPGRSRLEASLPNTVTTKTVPRFQTLSGVGGGHLHFRNIKQLICIPPYMFIKRLFRARHSAGREAFSGEE